MKHAASRSCVPREACHIPGIPYRAWVSLKVCAFLVILTLLTYHTLVSAAKGGESW